MSKPSCIDKIYQRYADTFNGPETAESIELGFRALHWMTMENHHSSIGHLVVQRHANEAQIQALRRQARTPVP